MTSRRFAINSMVLLFALVLLVSLGFHANGHLDSEQEQQADDSTLLSPSPRDYVDLHRRACTSGTSNKDELTQYYENTSKPGTTRLLQLIKFYRQERECRREPEAWRYRYIDEAGLVQVREDTIDERLANVAYLARTVKAFGVDTLRYDWGDKRADARNMELAAGPQVEDDLCGEQLRHMLRSVEQLAAKVRTQRYLVSKQLQNSGMDSTNGDRRPITTTLTDQDISLAKVLDSFGRYEPGHLYGRIIAPGSYHQCRLNRLVVNETSHFGMRYCWAHLMLDKHLDASLKARFRDKYETPYNVLTAGVCLPEACHSKSFYKHKHEVQALLDSQFKLPESMYVDETLPVESIYCLVDQDSSFGVPPFGKALIGFLVLWPVLALLVTLARRKRAGARSMQDREEKRVGQKEGVSALASLDLVESWHDFTCASHGNKRNKGGNVSLVELDALNAVKVFGCTFVVLGHTFVFTMGFSMDDVRIMKLIEDDGVLQVLVAGTLVVDTFFAITGILWAYFTLKHLHKLDQLPQESGNSAQKPLGGDSKRTDGTAFFCKNWFQLTLFRYLRIVPLLVLAHWFKKFVVIYVGSGPLWDHGMNKNTLNGACHHESMWTPFTFLSAFYPLMRQCTIQTWSISNDLLFSILAPPIIMLIYKRPRLAAKITLVAFTLGYLAAHYSISLVPSHLDEELRELHSFGFYRFFDKISQFYTAPQYRVFCFVFGLWGGYLLHHYQLKAGASRNGNCASGRQDRDDKIKQGPREHNSNEDAGRISADGESDSGDKLADGDNDCEELKSRRAAIVWPKWLSGPATWISIGYATMIFVAFANRASLVRYADPIYRAIYPEFLTGIRYTWALSNVIIFLRMVTDWKDSSLMRLSASKFFHVLTKLNYAVLLIHVDLILYTFQASPRPPAEMSIWLFTNLGSGVLLACIPLSIFIHVVYENTIDKLIKSVLPI